MTILHLSVTWDTGHLCSQMSCQGKTCSFASSSAQHWCTSLVLFVKDEVLFLSLVYQNYFCPHLNLCWKSRVQRKKDVCPRPQTPLSCAHSSLGWTYADTQDRPIRTYMERAEENYLRLPFRAWCLPAMENPSRDKAQTGFIMSQEEWNSPLCRLGAWIFIRPHPLDFPGKCLSEVHS